MHESSLIKDMLNAADQVCREQGKKVVRKLTVELPEFGSLSEEHFRFHFDEEIKGTPWQNTALEIKRVRFGADAKLVSVTLGE